MQLHYTAHTHTVYTRCPYSHCLYKLPYHLIVPTMRDDTEDCLFPPSDAVLKFFVFFTLYLAFITLFCFALPSLDFKKSATRTRHFISSIQGKMINVKDKLN